jgi:hypothetical protein
MKMHDSGERMTYDHGADREPSAGKGAYELVSPFALERIAMWCEAGAKKYADRNWEKGIPFGRLIQSALRHMIRWMKGQRDEDHLAAVCWNVMAMMHFEETGQAEEWNNYPAYKRSAKEPEKPTDELMSAIEATHPGLAEMEAAEMEAAEMEAAFRRVAEVVKDLPPPNPHQRGYRIIAVDFDGCLCENAWPEIGKPNVELIERLKASQMWGGDKLILWTCREGESLAKAVEWCKARGLVFDAVNENLPERIEQYGGDSRKVSADLYLDDKAKNVKA